MQRKRKGNDRQAYQSHIKRQEHFPDKSIIFCALNEKHIHVRQIVNNVFFIVSFYFEFDVAKLRSFHLHVNRKKYI